MLAYSGSDGNLLPGPSTTVFLPCTHMAEEARDLSGDFLIRALIPFMEAPHSGPNHLSKDPILNTVTLGVRISTHELGEDIFSP